MTTEMKMAARRFNHNWAVFLDRDGTVTEEVGYVNHLSRLNLIPGAAEGIRLLNDVGVPVILATNQAGVARGYFDEHLVKAALEKLGSMLGALGARLDAVYYCPHHPAAGEPPYRADCDCRKPKPGMLLRGAKEFGLDLSRSYVIGDKISDVYFAKAGGAKGILVTTGYGLGELAHQRAGWRCEPHAIVPDVYAASRWIFEKEGL